MVQIFDELKDKAALIKPTFEKVFAGIPAFKFIDTEQIIVGFFYFFIYKDFLLRELINFFSKAEDSEQN